MLTEHDLALPFIEAMKPWREYALKFPLKALHEALDPQFRKNVALPEGLILSSVLVIVAVENVPLWMMNFGLYSAGGRFLAERPAVRLARWPAVYRDEVLKVARRLILEVGGEGEPSIIKRPLAISACRRLTGVEARASLTGMRYPLLNRPDRAHGE